MSVVWVDVVDEKRMADRERSILYALAAAHGIDIFNCFRIIITGTSVYAWVWERNEDGQIYGVKGDDGEVYVPYRVDRYDYRKETTTT